MKLLILANHYNTLRIFRRELLLALSAAGHQVTVTNPPIDEDNRRTLESYGVRVLFTDMERRGTNPVRDLALLRAYRALLRREQPDKVITYTIKPNIYGGLACKSLRVPHYANVTGLGSAFEGRGAMRALVSAMYRISLRWSRSVFFENAGNRDTLVRDRIVRPRQAVVLPGAGVNLAEFAPAPYPENESPLRFLFVGRIMREKGVEEYFAAIRRLRQRYPDAEFDFIGWYEDHYEETVRRMEQEGLIRFHGFQLDVKPFIRQAHCVVLPSWHEGMSNTLLESAAMCRPLITSRIHGCMEAVEEGETGYLTQVQDQESLYEALARFAELPLAQKREMGLRGRELMLRKFDKDMVVRMTMDEIFQEK